MSTRTTWLTSLAIEGPLNILKNSDMSCQKGSKAERNLSSKGLRISEPEALDAPTQLAIDPTHPEMSISINSTSLDERTAIVPH